MCGICGLYNYGAAEPVSETLVRRMADRMIHRGPDDEGFHVADAVGLGVRRLSIIDIAGGHQPMSSEDGAVWIVLNGEIYNFPDLRRELESKGHVFRTRSDTETVIHAYEEWGLDALPRLNGMYAFAIWDSPRQELILARDPFGIKPLYYADRNGRLVFGSEIKAILVDSTIPRAVDAAALDEFLTLAFVPSPNTLFSGIRKLPPGHLLRVSRRGTMLQRFCYSPPRLGQQSEREWIEALRAGIEAAVRRQLISDVPIGVMLSGGMDSAIVATLLRRAANTSIHSFTVGFGGDFSQNELAAARRSADLIGSEQHEAMISADEYAEFLPRSLWYLEEPIANPSTLAFYWICRLASQYVKVVLTGQGADEPFAGYPRHFGEYYGGVYRQLPPFLREHVLRPVVDRLPRNEQLKRAVHSLDIEDSLARICQVYTIFDVDFRRHLYRDALFAPAGHDIRDAVSRWQRDVESLDGLSQMLYVDARFSLPDNLLMYGDKMSMAASLEARVPFLDLELMALVESIPPEMKIRGRTQKYLLKRAASAWVAPEIVERKKIGFATPIDQWFGRELRNYVRDQLLAGNSACRRYFEPKAIEAIIADHESRRHDYKRHLFALLTFELWHRQFISAYSGEPSTS